MKLEKMGSDDDTFTATDYLKVAMPRGSAPTTAAACFIGVYVTFSTGRIFHFHLSDKEIYQIVANMNAFSDEKTMAPGYCNDLTTFNLNIFYGDPLLDYGNELYRYHYVYNLGLVAVTPSLKREVTSAPDEPFKKQLFHWLLDRSQQYAQSTQLGLSDGL